MQCPGSACLLSQCVYHHLNVALTLLEDTTVACTINILRSSNDASRTVFDGSRVLLQIVVSLTNNSKGII
jgi:hypothetical protein